MRGRRPLASALGPTPGCSSWCERFIRLAYRAFSHVFREGAGGIRFAKGTQPDRYERFGSIDERLICFGSINTIHDHVVISELFEKPALVNFLDHVFCSGSKAVCIAPLEILFHLIAKPAALAIMWRFRGAN
jgi:hypothetical protein